jgi:hypothetical protein
MKKTLPALLLALVSTSAFAQIPTLTASNNPIIGDTYKVYSTDTFNAGAGGASASWNFSTLTIHSTDTVYYSACSASPYCSTFPGTTLWYHSAGTTNHLYFNATSAKQSVVGTRSTGNIPYSNSEDLLRFPLTYTNTYIDTFAATYTSTSTFSRKGTVTVTADGYGTLILPTGTYTNALRVHRVEDYSDTMVGFPFGFGYLTDMYTWYVPGARSELLSLVSFTISGASTTKYAYYTSVQPSAVSILHNSVNEVETYPNPVKGELNIQFSVNESADIRISIVDMIGKELAVISNEIFDNGTHNLAYNTSSLPIGMYLLRIQTEEGVITRKIQVL